MRVIWITMIAITKNFWLKLEYFKDILHLETITFLNFLLKLCFQSDDETEKADSTKDEKEKLTEAVKGTFGDRLASFFRINKSFNMDDEKIDESEKKTDDDELQKVIFFENVM